jgi:hypothetical protein
MATAGLKGLIPMISRYFFNVKEKITYQSQKLLALYQNFAMLHYTCISVISLLAI